MEAEEEIRNDETDTGILPGRLPLRLPLAACGRGLCSRIDKRHRDRTIEIQDSRFKPTTA